MSVDDTETIERFTARLAHPDYVRRVVTSSVVCARYGLTPQQISNWVARSDRTGVHHYRGGYDPNEVLRWLLIRGERKTRRDRRSA